MSSTLPVLNNFTKKFVQYQNWSIVHHIVLALMCLMQKSTNSPLNYYGLDSYLKYRLQVNDRWYINPTERAVSYLINSDPSSIL